MQTFIFKEIATVEDLLCAEKVRQKGMENHAGNLVLSTSL